MNLIKTLTTSAFLLTVVGAFSLTACTGNAQMNAQASGQGQGKAMGQGKGKMMAKSCPMKVTGTTVVAEDTPKGAAFVFTTTGDVQKVQKRAHMRADMHNKHHGPGATAPKGDEMPPSEAVVEDLPNGAKLIIRPLDPANLEKVRKMVHEKAAKMAKMHAGG